MHLENGETKKRAVYDDFEAGSGPGGKKIKRATHVPDFLTRSGVTGAEEVYVNIWIYEYVVIDYVLDF